MTHTPAHLQSRHGFTLVETLVAIAILMIAIVGPYYSIQQAIMTSYSARDQLIASQLAQEAEEYIYFLRDTNYLQARELNASGVTWLSGMDNCRTDNPYNHTYGCAIDPSRNVLTSCDNAACTNAEPLNENTTTGLFTTQSGNPVTRFTRIVKITNVNATEVEVMTTVTWTTEHRSFTIKTVDDLYNWL